MNFTIAHYRTLNDAAELVYNRARAAYLANATPDTYEDVRQAADYWGSIQSRLAEALDAERRAAAAEALG
jgi:hypothetical protein